MRVCVCVCELIWLQQTFRHRTILIHEVVLSVIPAEHWSEISLRQVDGEARSFSSLPEVLPVNIFETEACF